MFSNKIKRQLGKANAGVWIFAALFLLAIPLSVSATVYQPGATLNPDCSPGSSNCGVVPPVSPGANSSLTSLSGLTTPLPAGEGGTGLSAVGLDGQILKVSGGALTWSSLDTSAIVENGQLYFTNARARSAISSSAAGLSYSSSTGVFSLASGYKITQTASSTQWDNLYHNPSAIYGASGGLQWTGNSIGIANNYSLPLAASSTAWNNFYHNPSLVIGASGNLQWTGNTLGVINGYAIPSTASSTQLDNLYHNPSVVYGASGGLQWNGNSIGIANNYSLPLAASSTEWNNFYHNPSLVIATSSNLQWTGNSLGVMSGYSIPLTASTTDWNNLEHSHLTLNSFSSSLAGLNYSTTTGVFSAASGYEIPTSASVSQWNSFYQNPSTVIEAGSNCSWTGNTFNCASATSTPPSAYTYSAAGSLLQLQGMDFSVKAGALTHGKGCIYDAGSGLVCNSDFIGLASLSSSAPGLNYDNSTGQFSWNSNYNLPLTASTTQWNAAAHANYLTFNSFSSSAVGLHYDNLTGQFSWDSGYGGYQIASGTNWQTFYNTPANRIAAAGNLAWAGNSLGVADNYAIPAVASSSQWNSFYHTPSGRISLGAGLSWTGNSIGIGSGYTLPTTAGYHNAKWDALVSASTSLPYIPIGTSIGEPRWNAASTSVAYLSGATFSGAISATNLSGINTGDNAANSNYAGDYRSGNFIAGTNYLSPTGDFHGTWSGLATTSFALGSSLNSYLLRSASTSIPGYLTSNAGNWAGTWQNYNPSYFASTTKLSSYLLKSASTSIPGYQSTSLTKNYLWLGNSSGIAAAVASDTLPYYASNNPSNYISSITSGMVTGALGFTPYSNANPSSFIGLGAISSNAAGLTYNNTNGQFSWTSGYSLPLSASSTNWDNFWHNPSNQISLGTGLSWTGNSIGIGSGYTLPTISGYHNAKWDAIVSASTSLPYLSNTTNYLDPNGNFHGTWSGLASTSFALNSSLNSYLLRSASTSIPGYLTSTGGNWTGTWQNYNYNNLPYLSNTTTLEPLWRAASSSLTAASSTQWNSFFHTPSGQISLGTGLSWTGNSIGINGSYVLPLSASTTNWNNFYNAPSNRISLGAGLSWTGNSIGIGSGYTLPTTAGYNNAKWDALVAASTSLPYLSNTTSYLNPTGNFHGTWSGVASTSFALGSSLNSYLLRSASTSIPGYLSNSLTHGYIFAGNGAGIAAATNTLTILNGVVSSNSHPLNATSSACISYTSSTSFAQLNQNFQVNLGFPFTIYKVRCRAQGGTSVDVGLYNNTTATLMSTTTCATTVTTSYPAANNTWAYQNPAILYLSNKGSASYLKYYCFDYYKN